MMDFLSNGFRRRGQGGGRERERDRIEKWIFLNVDNCISIVYLIVFTKLIYRLYN